MRKTATAIAALGVGAAAAFSAVPASAADTDTAKLSVLHGVPDTPVDVYVNGTLTLDDFMPGELAGPLDLPGGNYQLAITAADAADASAPIIGPISADLAAGGNYTAAANLDASGKPTANLFHGGPRQVPPHGPPCGCRSGRGCPGQRHARHLGPGQPQ